MSLETDVANLVTQTNALLDYFKNRKAGIDSAVAAAIAAAPETVRTWYIDAVNGSDANAGTAAAPFKTLGKAVANTPAFGVCIANLLSDYVLDTNVAQTTTNLLVVGSGAVRKLSVKYYPVVNADTSVTTYLGGFQLATQASCIEFRNLAIELPSIAGVAPAPTINRITGLVRTNGTGNVPPFLGVSLSGCTVTMAVDFIGALVGSTVSAISLLAISTSFPSGFGGKYVMGIASGTAPKDTSNVLSNINSL